MPKYIDIHSHTNFKVYDEDRDAVISRALENDTWMINIGTQYDTSNKAVEIADKYNEGVYAIIGLHPIHTGASFHDESELGIEGKEFTSRGEEFDKDIYRDESSIEKQKTAFIAQIELANELGLSLMLHIRNNEEDTTRNAYTEALEIIKQYAKVKGDVHFFAGTLEDAKGFIDFGFSISFTGAITYPPRKNGKGCDYAEVIRNIPLEMIMTDTDCPYVAPIPHRGKRNEPVYVSEIVKKIAEIKNLGEEEVAKQIVLNAKRLFDI